MHIWGKVFKSGPKACFPKTLWGSLLNTLAHINREMAQSRQCCKKNHFSDLQRNIEGQYFLKNFCETKYETWNKIWI